MCFENIEESSRFGCGCGCWWRTFFVYNFLENNMVYTLDIRVYINIYINTHNIFLVGFIFSTSWGSGHKNSKTPSRLDFFKIVLKVRKNTKDFPVN